MNATGKTDNLDNCRVVLHFLVDEDDVGDLKDSDWMEGWSITYRPRFLLLLRILLVLGLIDCRALSSTRCCKKDTF